MPPSVKFFLFTFGTCQSQKRSCWVVVTSCLPFFHVTRMDCICQLFMAGHIVVVVMGPYFLFATGLLFSCKFRAEGLNCFYHKSSRCVPDHWPSQQLRIIPLSFNNQGRWHFSGVSHLLLEGRSFFPKMIRLKNGTFYKSRSSIGTE